MLLDAESFYIYGVQDGLELASDVGDVRGKMGYAACEASFTANNPLSGSVGSGTGATVGKAAGIALAQKAGIGYAAVQMGPLQIGVAVVLNSYGDIFYRGKKIAGMQSDEADSYTTLLQTAEENLFIATPSGTTNTTLVAIFTNGDFTPAQLKHLSQMASAGLARSISPAFTTADGDTVYAISVGPDEEKVSANLNAVGALSASLVEEAIAGAVYSAGPLLLR